MARPSKPIDLIVMEGKGHRTKKEIRQRKKAEEETLTKEAMTESKKVKNDPIAHEEFLRIRRLLKKIGKADDLYGNAINRYCLILSECAQLEKSRDQIMEDMKVIEKEKENFNIKEYAETKINMSKMIISYDRQIQSKRKMMFDIEKENIMTIAAALRSVPKKQETKKNALMEALNG